MYFLLITLLVGINLSILFLYKIHIWHAQGIWAQGCILVLFSWTFFVRPKEVKIRNVPLGLFHLWIGITTLFICYVSQLKGKYDIQHFLPYFNFLCVVILYKIIVEHIHKYQIPDILKYLRYTIIFTMIVCVLQKAGLHQFFYLLSSDKWHNNIVVGFIGNPTHLSGFLASTIPLFLWKRTREDWLAIVLMFLILCLTGTTLNDPSISGFVIGICLFIYMYKVNKKKLLVVVASILFLCFLFAPHLPSEFFHPHGRLEIWKVYWKLFHSRPVTGQGIGTMKAIHKFTIIPQAQHMHMEYFQVAFELGLVGLALAINMIKHYFSLNAETREQLVLKGMFLGFCISCCFNFPAHLWLPATWATFAYAGMYAIKNEEL